MTDLLFRRLSDSALPADLIFGEPAGPILDSTGHFDIALGVVAPAFEALLEYDLAVSGSDVIGASAGWQTAEPIAPAHCVARHAGGEQIASATRVQWARGVHAVAAVDAHWQQLESMSTSDRIRWGRGSRLSRVAAALWQLGNPLPGSTGGSWQSSVPAKTSLENRWNVADIVTPRPRHVPWGLGSPAPVIMRTSAQSAVRAWQRPVRIRWTSTEAIPAGRSVIVTPPIPPTWRCYTPPAGSAVNLLFDERWAPGADLLFSCGGSGLSGPLVIPILEFYLVINTVTLVRADTGRPLDAQSLQVSIDRDGPHWTWSASLRASDRFFVLRDPDPVELIATINGVPFSLVVERISRDRRFASDGVRIGGRGVSRWLSGPSAGSEIRYNTDAQTAQQIAADVLSSSGVSIGWDLDWQLPDWLIPAGVWSHQGTYMEALIRLAEAGGGYVQAHAHLKTLRALPHYPVAPWAWATATPDILLPEDVVEVEGTESVDRPDYNAVYVEGQGAGGRRDRILRAGSAGDSLAPQIVDALATHVDMTRARGISVLADTGAQELITLRLPVLPESGLILPGKLIEYHAEGIVRRGLSRSFLAEFSAPELWQTIQIETHG